LHKNNTAEDNGSAI